MSCSELLCVAVSCSVLLQCVAECCRVLQSVTERVAECVAECCSVLPTRSTVSCSVVKCHSQNELQGGEDS